MRPAVKVARIAGASRHSRLETEPTVDEAFHKLGGLVSFVEGKSFNSLNLLI